MAEAATPDKGAEKPARTSREEAMAQIGNKRAEELNTELSKDDQIEVTAATLDDDDDADERVAAAERKRLEREAAKAESGGGGERDTIYDFLDEPDLAKTKVRVKVDGHEEELVLADALKDVQKLRSASKRLEEASIAKRQAEDMRAAAEAEAAEIKRRATEEAAPVKKEAPSGTDGFDDAINLMYEGDQGKSAGTLREAVMEAVRREKAGATVDVVEITKKVREQVAWDSALEQFSVDHKDIVTDERSLKYWQDDLNAVAAESSTPAEAVRKATERFLGWRNRAGSGGDKVTTDDGALAARAAAKRQGAERAVRSSTSLASGVAPRDTAPLTPSQVIEEMKKLRGQVN